MPAHSIGKGESVAVKWWGRDPRATILSVCEEYKDHIIFYILTCAHLRMRSAQVHALNVQDGF